MWFYMGRNDHCDRCGFVESNGGCRLGGICFI